MYKILIVVYNTDFSCVSTQIVDFKFKSEADIAVANLKVRNILCIKLY